MSEVAKPEKFTAKVKWVDWAPTFKNFLDSIPSKNGIPLSYVIRDQDEPEPVADPSLNFMQNMVQMVPLHGEDYT